MSVENHTIIRSALVKDASGFVKVDIEIVDGKIERMEPGLSASASRIIDADGLVVSPSFYDLHAHTRVPGSDGGESLESITAAAALGGFRYLLAMPNTDPTIDSVDAYRAISSRLEGLPITVEQSAAITFDRGGESIVDIYALAEAGARFFTDDGSGVRSASIMRQALEISASLGVVIAQHAQDADLSVGACMNEGATSARMGVKAVAEVAEAVMVARDIELCKATGGRLHVLHVSARESINLIRQAKRDGLRVTAEVTPHHLLLDDSVLAGFDPVFKVNPPLRSIPTRMALNQALIRGDFDAIATDHAPHPGRAKDRPLAEAAFGMLGLQTAFAASWTAQLAHPGWTDDEVERGLRSPQIPGLEPYQIDRLHRVLDLLSVSPAQLTGHDPSLRPGSVADVVLIDPTYLWVPTDREIVSLSHNFPYRGMTLNGKVIGHLIGGVEVVREGKLCL